MPFVYIAIFGSFLRRMLLFMTEASFFIEKMGWCKWTTNP